MAEIPDRDGASGTIPHLARTLDPIAHERTRLGILCVLAERDTVAFTELRDLLGLTDGNLSVHARRLQEAAYISSTKATDQRTPRTHFRLTPAGRKALTQHLDRLNTLIRALGA